MSTDLNRVQPATPFQGVVSRLPIRQRQGAITPPGAVPPSVVPAVFRWNVYWQLLGNPTSVAVDINLQAQSVQASILDRIASVKIDNTGSSCPVYVWFQDTNDVIACAPNMTIVQNVMTNNLTARVIVQGLTAGNIPETRVFFSNMEQPPTLDPEIANAVALWRASPVISRGDTIYNTLFGIPALGDTSDNVTFSLTASNSTLLFGGVKPSGFYYLTGIDMSITGCRNDATQLNILTVDDSAGYKLFVCNYAVGPTTGSIPFAKLLSLTSMQLKLDATRAWRLFNTGTPGFGQVSMSYVFTYQP